MHLLLVYVLQVMSLIAQRHRRVHNLAGDAELLVVQLIDETPVAFYQATDLKDFVGDLAGARRAIVEMNTTFAA